MIIKKKISKKQTIKFDDETSHQVPIQNVQIQYEEDQLDQKQYRIKRLDPSIVKAPIEDVYNLDYIKNLQEENNMNNLLVKKSLQEETEINNIDIQEVEDDETFNQDYIDQMKQRRQQIRDEQNYIDLNQNLITDMDKKRMVMVEQIVDKKFMYNDDQDDEELNRWENNLIKSNNNKMHIPEYHGQPIQQLTIPTFNEIYNYVQTKLRKEYQERDRLQEEINRSEQAIQSSEFLIKNWKEQINGMQKEISLLSDTDEYLHILQDMLKEKAPMLFRKVRQYLDNDIEDKYQFKKEINQILYDVDEDYLDVDKINNHLKPYNIDSEKVAQITKLLSDVKMIQQQL